MYVLETAQRMIYYLKYMKLTPAKIRSQLKTVIDPELNVNIVDLGLIYDVSVQEVQTAAGKKPFVHILMTLTTPGCPLAGIFDGLVRGSLEDLPGLDATRDVDIELTFDPPWLPDMMSEAVRAELGFD